MSSPTLRQLNGHYSAREFGLGRAGLAAHTAINRAITQANADGGGVVELPADAGTVILDGSIEMRSNVELAIPYGVTLQLNTGLERALIVTQDPVAGISNIRITGGGTLDGNRANQDGIAAADLVPLGLAGPAVHGISLVGVTDGLIEGVTVTGAYAHGIHLETALRVELRGVTTTENGRDGVRMVNCVRCVAACRSFNNGKIYNGKIYGELTGSELLSNTGFETAGGGGADVFGSWTENAGDGDLLDETTIVRSGGSHSLNMNNGALADTYVMQAVAVTATYHYRLRFWAYGDGTNAGRYQIRDATAGADIVATTTTGITAATWTHVTVDFIAPVGCSSVEVYLRCSPAGAAGTVYVDDVSVFELDGGDGIRLAGTSTDNVLIGLVAYDSAAAGAKYQRYGVLEDSASQARNLIVGGQFTGNRTGTTSLQGTGSLVVDTPVATTGTPSTQAFGDAAALGSGTSAAPLDHKHAMPANPVTGGLTRIAETVLTEAAASISFAAIAGTYSSLLLILTGRGDAAAADNPAWLRFNGDAGANYDWHIALFDGTAASNTGDTRGPIGNIPEANALANRAGIVEILIPHYAKTTFHKKWLARTNWHNSAGEAAPPARNLAGTWRSAAAITDITILPNSGNFVAGTVATLYGMG